MNADDNDKSARVTEHQRAYKACLQCRKRKAKCDLGGREGPPCVRCRREQRECLFPVERSSAKKRRLDGYDDDEVRGSSRRVDAVLIRADSRTTPVHQQGRHSYGLHVASREPDDSNIDDSVVTSEIGDSTHMQDPEPDLAHSVMRTVVSSGNDALNLLFQAAAQSQRAAIGTPNERNQLDVATPLPPGAPGTTVDQTVLKMWRNSRFVRMGWVSAEEIIIYMDFFFTRMAPLSPVLTNYYADHNHHHILATKEPLLCCTILMIASRHYILQSPQGHSRSYFVHRKFWEYCQHLIMKLIYGQEKGSITRTRTLGTIEALILLSEWHPRSLHFPPETDGWDSDLILMANDEDQPGPASSLPDRWLQDVIEPARRSDRMSGMLLGCALSLAYELNIFGESGSTSCGDASRKLRIRKLLFVFVNQLSSRLGTMSMLPQGLTHVVVDNARSMRGDEHDWNKFMSGWTELTKLLKSLSDMMFPSEAFTQQLLHSGRYVSILEHFQPLLEQWRGKFLKDTDISASYHDILFIEYQYVRIYCNSIGMQAVCERTCAEQSANGFNASLTMPLNVEDQAYVQEVIAGSCELLEKVVDLAGKDMLRLAPVRVFLRTTTASVYLLKAMSIGVRNGQLKKALNVLHRSVEAIKSNVVDDMHLANSYAVLLETHIKRLEKGFAVSTGQSRSRRSAGRDIRRAEQDRMESRIEGTTMAGARSDWEDMDLAFNASLTENDWLSLPFDPAMAPFGVVGAGLDSDGLDFIWNLPS